MSKPLDRGVVQNPLAQQADAPAMHNVVAPGGVHLAQNASMSRVGSEDMALSQVLSAGADFALKEYREGQKEDFVNGQMAQQQGKSLDEYNKVSTSHAFISGFRNMQAQTLADKVYSEQAAEIEAGDFSLTPEQYREKQTGMFKSILTGNEETDRYITQLAVANNSKLAKQHIAKHEAWKVEEASNSGRDLISSKIGLSASSPEDYADLKTLLSNPKQIPGMEHLSVPLIKKTIADGIVQGLENGSDAGLRALHEVANGRVDGPAPKEAGNIDLFNRKKARNADGSVSTVRSMSFNDGTGEILIPTVIDGKVVSDKEAIAEYEKTGKHLGKFDTPEEADAYAKSLHNQQERLYTKKGVQLEGLGFSAAQLGDIRQAHKRWDAKEQDKFVLAYEQEIADLDDLASNGRISREAYAEKFAEISERYGKTEDRFKTMAYRKMLAGYGETSPEVVELMMRVSAGASQGVSWEKLKPALDQQLDKMGATPQTRMRVYNALGQGVESFRRRQQARADAAYERAQARQEEIASAVDMRNGGNLFAATDRQKQLAYSALEAQEEQAMQKAADFAKSKGLPFDWDEANTTRRNNVANAINSNGVVSPLHSDMWTAGFSMLTADGTASPLTRDTIYGFTALARKNPALAMQHLKGDDAKAVGKLVIDNVNSGMEPEQAISLAVNRVSPVTGSKDMRKAAKSLSQDLVAEKAAGLFIGSTSSLGFGIGIRNAKAAQQSPVLQNALMADAKRLQAQYPGLSDMQAVDQAGLSLSKRVGVVGGNVLVSKGKSIGEVFGVGPLKNDDDLHHIVMHVMQKHGPEMYGKDWDKTSGIIDAAWRGVGDPAHMHMALDNVTNQVIVTTYNTDGSLNTSLRVPAEEIGREWRASGLDPSQVQQGMMKAIPYVKAAARLTPEAGMIGGARKIGPAVKAASPLLPESQAVQTLIK